MRINEIRSLMMIGLVSLEFIASCSKLPGKAVVTATPGAIQEFEPTVSATGIIIPARWATLSMATDGVVEEVLATEDLTTQADDLLVRLQGQEELQAAVSTARLELVSAQQTYDDLKKDMDTRIAQAKQTIVQDEKAVKDAQYRLDNLGKPATHDVIQRVEADLAMARLKLDLEREKFQPYRHLPDISPKRTILQDKLSHAQQEYDAILRSYNSLTGIPSPYTYKKATADLDLAQAKLASAQGDYQTLLNNSPSDLKVAEERLSNAQNQLNSAEAALVRLDLHSPFSGTVIEVYVHSHEHVSAGQPVLLLADLQNLQVETTDLNEISMARIKVGNPVTVTFDALPELVVSGKVARIASKSSTGSGVNYKVVVEMERVPDNLRWGMTAFVDIAAD